MIDQSTRQRYKRCVYRIRITSNRHLSWW